MKVGEMQPFVVWAGVIQAVAIFEACERHSYLIAFYSAVSSAIICWMVYVQHRKENPNFKK
jgi:hypothetical protein